MHLVPLSDTQLAVHTRGSGLPLLLLHGFPLDHAMWAGQDPLADHLRLIVPDQRGFGRSGGAVPESIPQLADDAVAVLAGAGIDCLQASSTGKLSRYNVMGQKREKAPRIYVVQRQPGCLERVLSLEDATRIFERYQDERHIARVYVPEDRVDEAQAMMRKR